MKKQIIKFLRRLADGMILGLGIAIVISILGFAAVQANIISGWGSSSGDTGITIDSNSNNLYTTANNQLTAAKWNALVQRTKREDVTDTALFDTNCQRRIFDGGNLILYPGYMNTSDIYLLYSGTIYWDIKYSDKTKFQTSPGTQSSVITKIQRMCNK